MIENNTVICGDCIKEMSKIKEETIDLIFVDPPYNLQLSNNLIRADNGNIYNGVDDTWDNFESPTSYDNFTKQWLTQAQRILSRDGTIIIMGDYHSIYRIGTILQNMGFWILNDIQWIKSNPTPNFTGKRLCNSHETIIWATKSEKSKYFFNYHFMKHLNHGKQMRSDWTMPICAGKERILDENGMKAHSTQKPLQLMQRLVLMASKVGDIVLDPMCGTGTVLVAAKMYGRQYIGIDNDDKSVNISTQRLQSTTVDNDLLKVEEEIQKASKPVRVAFETIVSDGKINVDTQLRFHKTPKQPLQEYAVVTSDGQVVYNGTPLSIHKAARQILNRVSANGWKHWYYDDPVKGYTCINTLREDYK